MRPSIPYAETPYGPYWGTQTSKSNFCEEDYIVTPYIGEFVNTITHVSYTFYALHRLYRQRQTHAPWTSRLPYIGLLLVGLFSAWFHAVLHYHAQMADDLSMHLATICVFYRVLTFNMTSERSKQLSALMILTGLVAFMVYHSIADEHVVHEASWGLMLVYIGFKTRWIVKTKVMGRELKRRIRRLSSFGALCGVAGYTIWQLDFRICGELTRVRRSMGMPWGWLLEFHGWWHILTAVMAYVFMALVEFLTDGAGDEKAYLWPVGTYLVDVKLEKEDGKTR